MPIFMCYFSIDDDPTSLVVGNVSRNKETAAYADENISVQLPIIREDAEVDDTKSVTLKAEHIPDGIGRQGEPKIDRSHFPSSTDTKVKMTLSPQSPRKQSPSSKPQHHSISISAGKYMHAC